MRLRSVVSVMVVAVVSVCGAQSSLPTNYFNVTGRGVVAGDFNRDGRTDLVALGTGNTLVFLRGNGRGQFSVPNSAGVYLSGDGQGNSASDRIVAADLNNDRALDVVAATYSGVYAALGNNRGDFRVAIPAFAEHPVGLCVGMFDGDGNPDLLVLSQVGTDGVVLFLKGAGDGSFALPQTILNLPDGPRGITAGRLDSDGILDAIVTRPNGIWLLKGVGNGTFQISAAGVPGYELRGAAIGDFTNDGNADVVVASSTSSDYSSRLVVLPGNGDGTLAPPQSIQVPGFQPQSVQLGDVTGDGLIDAVSPTDDGPFVLPGVPTGISSAAYLLPSPPSAAILTLGRFNSDSRLDAAACGSFGLTVWLDLRQPNP